MFLVNTVNWSQCNRGIVGRFADMDCEISRPRNLSMFPSQGLWRFRCIFVDGSWFQRWPWVSNMICKGRPRRCKIPSGFYRMVCHNVIAHNLMLIVCCQGLLLPDGWPYGARDFLEAGISTRSLMPGRWLRSSSMRPSTTSTTTLADDATDEDIAAFAEQLGGEIQSRMRIPGAHQNLLETVSFIQFYATFFNFLGPQSLRCHWCTWAAGNSHEKCRYDVNVTVAQEVGDPVASSCLWTCLPEWNETQLLSMP